MSLNTFISQSSQDHSPQPKIDFSYYEISGQDICSLICGYHLSFRLKFTLFYFAFFRPLSSLGLYEQKNERNFDQSASVWNNMVRCAAVDLLLQGSGSIQLINLFLGRTINNLLVCLFKTQIKFEVDSFTVHTYDQSKQDCRNGIELAIDYFRFNSKLNCTAKSYCKLALKTCMIFAIFLE